MILIDSYKTFDGAIFEDKEKAIKHLEKLEEPYANDMLFSLHLCDGKRKKFISLIQDRRFLVFAAKLLELMNEREVTNIEEGE
jgi:hypothetical protein